MATTIPSGTGQVSHSGQGNISFDTKTGQLVRTMPDGRAYSVDEGDEKYNSLKDEYVSRGGAAAANSLTQYELNKQQAAYNEKFNYYQDELENLKNNSAASQFDNAYWEELMKQTQSGYDSVAQSLRQSMAAQTDQAVNSLEGQKQQVTSAYDDLARQLYLEKRKGDKNLGQSLAAQGITGGGSESSALRLNNAYTSALSENEKSRIGQMSNIDTAITDARLQGEIATAQADANIQQQALSAYTSLMQAMRSESLTLAQIEQQRQEWALQLQMSITQWQAEYDNAITTQKAQVAAQAQADLERKAQTLAAYGDFSGYLAIGYTQAQVRAMQNIYNSALVSSGYSGSGSSGGGDDDISLPPDPKPAAGQSANPLDGYSDFDVLDALFSQYGDGAAFSEQAKMYNISDDTVRAWLQSKIGGITSL